MARMERFEMLAVEESPILDRWHDHEADEQVTEWRSWFGEIPEVFAQAVMELANRLDKGTCWECGMATVGYQLIGDDKVTWCPTWFIRELDVVPRPVAVLCGDCSPVTPREPLATHVVAG